MALKGIFQSILIPAWIFLLLVNSLYTFNRDKCDGNLHIYLFSCAILLCLWCCVFFHAKINSLSKNHLICMFIILCIHGLVSIFMTIKLSDQSIAECYKNDDEENSSTETKAFAIRDLLNNTWLKGIYSDSKIDIKWGFTFAIVTIYGNDVICVVSLAYGLYGYMTSRHFDVRKENEYQKL